MKNYNTFLNLPPTSLNILSLAFGVMMICLGVRIARASDIALEVANSKLVTSSSARRLEQLAYKLEQQAEVIEAKDEAYQDLKAVYDRSLKGNRSYGKLQQKIEQIEKLPEVESVKPIIDEIEATEEILFNSDSE